ncbi:MAG: TatD family hydrolase [Deltaproteobacteria bacterium]|nr:TatD family hydrolase [Deltaproteobacteria bacterium]
MYFDSHCHLDFEPLSGDIEGVLERATNEKVDAFVTIGTDLQSSKSARAIAEKYGPKVSFSVGIHPHEASSLDKRAVEELMEIAGAGPVAVGEIGLDFHYDHSPRPVQRTAFADQLDLARDLGLPVVIHSRDAALETLDILRAEKAFELGGVVHCFSYDYSMARKILDMGFHIGVTGVVTFKNAHDLKEVVKKTPLDSLLIETDAPYLAPVPYRGKTNEPAHVVYVAGAIAEIRSTGVENIAEATARNANRLFGKR